MLYFQITTFASVVSWSQLFQYSSPQRLRLITDYTDLTSYKQVSRVDINKNKVGSGVFRSLLMRLALTFRRYILGKTALCISAGISALFIYRSCTLFSGKSELIIELKTNLNSKNEFEIEKRIWNWNLELKNKNEIGIWNWKTNLKLKFEFQGPNCHFRD